MYPVLLLWFNGYNKSLSPIRSGFNSRQENFKRANSNYPINIYNYPTALCNAWLAQLVRASDC